MFSILKVVFLDDTNIYDCFIMVFLYGVTCFMLHVICHAPIAQLVEQLPFKQMVPGSSPGGRTTKSKVIKPCFFVGERSAKRGQSAFRLSKPKEHIRCFFDCPLVISLEKIFILGVFRYLRLTKSLNGCIITS